MVGTHRGRTIPLEIYHGVPKGWHASETIAEHARLGGVFPLETPDVVKPGAPAWLQYRATLYRMADGVRENDPACVELAVRYIELRHIGSYSGFVRSLLSRRLKHAALSTSQAGRLHEHFLSLVLSGERTEEFRHYLALWRRILTEEERMATVQAVSNSLGTGAAEWLGQRLMR